MPKHVNPNDTVEHTPFADVYVGKHRAPEPGSVRYFAPARTMGTLAELVVAPEPDDNEPVLTQHESTTAAVIDITDRIATHEFPRVDLPEYNRNPITYAAQVEARTGAHRAAPVLPIYRKPKVRLMLLAVFICSIVVYTVCHISTNRAPGGVEPSLFVAVMGLASVVTFVVSGLILVAGMFR